MNEPNDRQPSPPRPLERAAAYLLVISIPALAFVAASHARYGGETVQMHGLNEAYGLETTEQIVLPDFSIVARLSHGYGAQPGYGMSLPRFEEFAERLRNDEQFDVVLLGSSHAYRNFDPRVFAAHDVRMFNLGSTAQTPTETLFLLERFGQLNTSRVVIEVVPFQLRSGIQSARSARDMALNLPPGLDFVGLAMSAEDFDTTRLVVSSLFAEPPRFDELDGGVPIATISKCWYVQGGYCEWRETPAKQQTIGSYDFMPTAEGLENLRTTVETLQARGVDVVFAMAPMPRVTVDAARNYDEGIAAVRAVGDALDVPLLDYTRADSPLADRLTYPAHFYDDHHLNHTGVQIFNEQFVNDLKALEK